MTYSEKLRDPRWQKKRAEILSRDFGCCYLCWQMCGGEKELYQDNYYGIRELSVHHKYYEKGKQPWEYKNEALVTLCKDCHENEDLFREKFFDYIEDKYVLFAKSELHRGVSNRDLFQNMLHQWREGFSKKPYVIKYGK